MAAVKVGMVVVEAPKPVNVDMGYIANRVNRAKYFQLFCAEFGCNGLHVVLLSLKDFAAGGASPNISGTFNHEAVFINLGVVKDKRHIRKIILHEFFHQVLSISRIELPIWLNEGLAEYFSGQSLSYLSEGNPDVFRAKYFLELQRLNSEHELSIRKMTTQLLYEKPEHLIKFAYYHSQQLVKYLIGKYGLNRVFRFLKSMIGAPRRNWSSIFRAAFGVTELEFEALFLK